MTDSKRHSRYREEIVRLRERGHTLREIEHMVGCGRTTVRRALYPRVVTHEREYNAIRQRQGVCVDCGKQISSNASRPAARCNRCHIVNNVVPKRKARANG